MFISMPIYHIYFMLLSIGDMTSAVVRQVNLLYRHGDRSPVFIYPRDPYSIDTWSQGLGWLSEVGMQQQYALGKYLREEYGQLLNMTYIKSEIRVESSNVNRCLMSAYCNLAGLYPPSGEQQWNPNLQWQPIPVHTRPEVEDNKLALGKPCARYNFLLSQLLHSPEVQREEKENAEFYSYLEKESGVKQEDISVVWSIGDTLFCERAHNLTLPPWTGALFKNETVLSKIMHLRTWSFELLFTDPQMQRLKGGVFLKEVIANMQAYMATPSNSWYKMHMYSAHDTTVAVVSSTVKVFNKLPPPYASLLLFELHEEGGQFCVKLRYRNDTTQPAHTLVHPDCQQECCPFETFVLVTKDYIPDDWESECQNASNDSLKQNLAGAVIGVLVILSILIVILIGLTWAYCRQRHTYTSVVMCDEP